MFRKTFAMMLAAIVLLTAFGFQRASANSAAAQLATEKIKSQVQKIGWGPNAKVEVKLRDGSQYKGYIKESDDNTFTVVENQSGADKTFSYVDTASVKKASGGGLSMKTWLIIGAAAAGTVATWLIVKPVLCDGGAQSRGPC